MSLPSNVGGLMAAMAKDPVLFSNVMLPKKPRDHIGQVTWLRNSVQPINVLVPANRWGKSTIIAMKHIWKCWGKVGKNPFEKRYETISVAMSADQLGHRVQRRKSKPRLDAGETSAV